MIPKIPCESSSNVTVFGDFDLGDEEIEETWRVFGDEFSVSESVVSSVVKIIH